MRDTVFTKVDYDPASLVKYIELGEIRLSDIQRPLFWKKVAQQVGTKSKSFVTP